MKKIIAALVVLVIAVPALATSLSYTQISGTEVKISYDASGDPCLVRAFGFDANVDSGAQVTDTNDTSSDYPIFPSNIVIDSQGNVLNYGSPVGNPGDHPDTQGGLGTDGVTVEMGSLYASGDPAPGTSGDLLVIEVNVPYGPAGNSIVDCNIAMADNAARGGIVLEDGTSGSSYGSGLIEFSTLNRAQYIKWVAWGKPANWRYKCWKCGDANGSGTLTGGDVITVFNDLKNNPGTGLGDWNMTGTETGGDVIDVFNSIKDRLGACPATCP